MTEMITPRGHRYELTWDAKGRLFRDNDPAGGYKQLTRIDSIGGYSVSLRTAMGRTTSYEISRGGSSQQNRLITRPDSTETSIVVEPSYASRRVSADGTEEQ
jgi:YD repeat-containing protein